MASRKEFPVTLEGFGARAREARAVAEVVRARAGQGPATAITIAAAVTELLGEEVGNRDVGKWLRGEAVPASLARIWAFAKALGVDPGWLAFGGESRAPSASVLESTPYATSGPVAVRRVAETKPAARHQAPVTGGRKRKGS